MNMKLLQKLCLITMLGISFSACQKNKEDYQPPVKGNVQPSYFIESTWNVQENTINIPDSIDEFCMRFLKKIYFGSQTCILTSQQATDNKTTDKREFKGTYRVVNAGGTRTYLYLDKMVNGYDTCNYKLEFDEISSSQSGMSLVLDLLEGTGLASRGEGRTYGSFRLKK